MADAASQEQLTETSYAVLRALREQDLLIEAITELVAVFEGLLLAVRRQLDACLGEERDAVAAGLQALAAEQGPLQELCGYAGSWGFQAFVRACLAVRIAAETQHLEGAQKRFSAVADAHQELIGALTVFLQTSAGDSCSAAAVGDAKADAKELLDGSHAEEKIEGLRTEGARLRAFLAKQERVSVEQQLAETHLALARLEAGAALERTSEQREPASASPEVQARCVEGEEQRPPVLDLQVVEKLREQGLLSDLLQELLPWLDGVYRVIKSRIDAREFSQLANEELGEASLLSKRAGDLGFLALARAATKLKRAAELQSGEYCSGSFAEVATEHQELMVALTNLLSAGDAT
eukprot:TRINITY_DN12469_c0_g2_i1.p1 TRINITY_DN12469_c0_g2~~TRINITY_DN12469_c0_g2_i1.p1  ORF type:complete len:351 (+),score=111.69 TRINITY_DN12469_c0_g2_i1:89-1141(+)